jgi:fermentation-respiration switch protein FrsA (DUF1100 family)
MKRRLLAVALLAGVVGYLSISYVVAERFTHAARHHVGRPPLVTAPKYEDVSVRSGDGITLRGWYFPTGGDRAAIIVHGKDSNRIMGENRTGEKIADFLIADGYNVLLFDLRGNGDSDGDRFSLGYQERRDVAAAIEYVTGRGTREDRIALIGISMGAGTVLQTLLLHPNVGAVVADSSYTDAPTIVSENLQSVAGVPAWFTPGVLLLSKVVFGLDGDQVRPIDVVRAHPERPILFIHCDKDELIALHHPHELLAASANKGSQLWIATGCQHAWAFNRHPVEYQARLISFLHSEIPAPTVAPGLTRYVNAELGYSVDLPTGWRRAVCSAGVVTTSPLVASEMFVGVPEAEEIIRGGARFVVVRVLPAEGLTPLAWLERNAVQPDARFEAVTLNGRPGARGFLGASGTTFAFAFTARGWIYAIEARPDPELERILTTLRVLDDATVGRGVSATPAPRSIESLVDSLADAFTRKDVTAIAEAMAPCLTIGAVPGDPDMRNRTAYLTDLRADFAAGTSVRVQTRPIENDPNVGRYVRSTWSRPGQPDQRVDLRLRAEGDRWSVTAVLIRTFGN